MKTRFRLLLLFLLVFSFSWAQDNVVSGTVTGSDDNMPIPGANVIVKGTTRGTSTDFDGKYTISVAVGETLEFSSIGFKTVEVIISNQSQVDVTLESDVSALDEVVLIGYGTQKKADLTSAIVTVDNEVIAQTPSSNVTQGLQGKIAGVQIVSSGSPGSTPTVRIRGIGSYSGESASQPLYVVDGMFYDNIDFLNANDVDKVTVFKDASAQAIYGYRAAGGVIVIQTKSGSYNQKAVIEYDGYTGVQVAQNVLKMANAEQFVTMAYESGSQPDIDNVLAAMQRFGRSRVNPNVPDVNTDWYDEILRPGIITSHALSAYGGSEKVKYKFGANYFSQEGILDMKNEYERFNLQMNADAQLNDRIKVTGNALVSNATRYLPEMGAWNQAYFAVPILPVYDPQNTDAYPTQYAAADLIGYRGGQNPFPTLNFNQNRQRIRKVLMGMAVDYEFIDHLTFRTNYNAAFTSVFSRDIGLEYYVSPTLQRNASSIYKRSDVYLNQIWDNTLTYQNSFGDHNVTAMIGFSYIDDSGDSLWASGSDLIQQDEEYAWYLNQANIINEQGVGDDGIREYGIPYFARVAYNYKDKYLIYGTVRNEGSNKYQVKRKTYPAIGAGWVVTEEDFFRDNGVFDFLKLRASWGQLGNNAIAASDGAATGTVINTAINDVQYSGTVVGTTFTYLSPEYKEETNFGLNAELFDRRLSIEADYYIKDIKDMVIPVYQPITSVFVRQNVGSMRNKGLEMSFNWTNAVSDDFSYSIGFNFATLNNEVTDLGGQDYLDSGSAEFRQRNIVGQPFNAFFGYEVAGVYQNQAEIDADPTAQNEIANGNNIEPGYFKYNDRNGDGVINDDDRTVIGSFFPDFTYGGNIGINYKDFGLNVSFYGQTGNQILNRKRGEVIWTPDLNMDADLAINRWHGEGTTNSYPSSAARRDSWNQKMSTFFVEDGDFFRVQNIQLYYTLKGKNLMGGKLPETKITFTADRPLTFFDYNGFSPEISNGVDTQTYPIPATYTLGINIKI